MKLILRSLLYYWRTNVGVVAGVVVAAAVLVGALVVGHSVDQTLRSIALTRIGDVQHAMITNDRFFEPSLAEKVGKEVDAPAAAVMFLRGRARNEAGQWANGLQVLGVDDDFFQLAPSGELPPALDEGVVLNRYLADRLQVTKGDTIRLRVEKPSLLPRDAPLSSDDNLTRGVPLTIQWIADDDMFGRFGLQTNQAAPLNVFVPRKLLAQLAELGRDDLANLLLVGQRDVGDAPAVQAVNDAMQKHVTLADMALAVREVREGKAIELRSDRVFLDPPIVRTARKLGGKSRRVMTYLANLLQPASGTMAEKGTDVEGEPYVPYSLVTGLEDASRLPGREGKPALGDNEIILNQWTADQLKARVGQQVKLTYFRLSPGRILKEKTAAFTVVDIVPIEGLAADKALMPDFPDVPQGERMSDWNPSFTLRYKIRPVDDHYWEEHRGTPKAFISLGKAQELWATEYGEVTAMRWSSDEVSASELAKRLRESIAPASIGFRFNDVRSTALKATNEALPLGQFFLGFSFFLIAAALILLGLLFAFGVEQRTGETGTLLALGYKPAHVRRLLVGEGAVLAVIGMALGALAGLGYTRLMLWGMATIWSNLPGATSIEYHVSVLPLVMGGIGALVVAVGTIAITVLRQVRRSARELMAASVGVSSGFATSPAARGWRRKIGLWLAIVGVAGAVATLIIVGPAPGMAGAAAFFVAGMLLLIGGLGACHFVLVRLTAGGDASSNGKDEATLAAGMSLGWMGLRASARRRGRSLATISLLAFGSFMVIGVHAFHKDADVDAHEESSGTGGYTLWGESTVPVLYDLSTREGRLEVGLTQMRRDEEVLTNTDLPWEGVSVVPFRMKEGDEASCLNLNRAQTPSLLAVNLAQLKNRFTFGAVIKGDTADGWAVLDHEGPEGAIPAVVDQGSLQWALKKSMGDAIEYVNERNEPVKVRIAGTVVNTLFQGVMIVSEDSLREHWPSLSGYRRFLIEVPREHEKAYREAIRDRLGDYGIELTSTVERLQQFNEVENTYLGIFQVLGALGLLIGSIGLGIVVLRNIMERRGEMSLLRAIGFERRALHWLVLSEHWLLLLLGLAVGVIAAAVAVSPAMMTPGRELPVTFIALTLLGILASGIVWTVGATALALRGELLDALREE